VPRTFDCGRVSVCLEARRLEDAASAPPVVRPGCVGGGLLRATVLSDAQMRRPIGRYTCLLVQSTSCGCLTVTSSLRVVGMENPGPISGRHRCLCGGLRPGPAVLVAPQPRSCDHVASVSMMNVRDLETVRLEPALDQRQQLEDPARQRGPRRPQPDDSRRAGGLDELGAKVRYRSPTSLPQGWRATRPGSQGSRSSAPSAAASRATTRTRPKSGGRTSTSTMTCPCSARSAPSASSD
jgi:hypothetical protein